MSFILTKIYYYYDKKPNERIFRKVVFSDKTLLSQVAFKISDFFSIKPVHSYIFQCVNFKIDSKTFDQFTPIKKKQYVLGAHIEDALDLMIESNVPHSFLIQKEEVLEEYKQSCPCVIEGKGSIVSFL